MASRVRPRHVPLPPRDEDDEWEYEYSTTETETYYLTLDLSARDFLERRTDDVVHNTRGGYRVWYNPLFNAAPDKLDNNKDEALDDDDGEPPEREEVDPLDNIGMNIPPQDNNSLPLDPLLRQGEPQTPSQAQREGTGAPGDLTALKQKSAPDPEEEIQILDLHSNQPIVSYRNHIFRGTWAQNAGTELIFSPRDDPSPPPYLRRIGPNLHLLAASSARINFQEVNMIARPTNTTNQAATAAANKAASEEIMLNGIAIDEDMPERYKRNGGIYVHIGGDKTGQRQPQAHFLEDLIALKRKKGEKDQVTVAPLETRQNKLMVEDEEEERRRRKQRRDYLRNARWRERGVGENGQPMDRSYVPRRGALRGQARPRTRRTALIRRESATISRQGPWRERSGAAAGESVPTTTHWKGVTESQPR